MSILTPTSNSKNDKTEASKEGPEGPESVKEDSEELSLAERQAIAAECRRGFLLGYSGRTAETYKETIDQFFGWCFSENNITVFDIERNKANEYRHSLEERGLAPATIARHISIVSAFYEFCLDEEVVIANPMRRVGRPRLSGDSSTNGLTRDEASRLLEEAKLTSKREHLIVAFLLLSGLRVSELCGLQIEDVGYNRGHRVATIHGKGGKVRNAPMSDLTSELFDDYVSKRKSGPVFPGRNPGEALTRHVVGRIIKQLAKGCGIKSRISPHSLRHSFVTLALDSGAALRDVQDAAGHASPETTRRYDRSRHNLDRHPTYRLADYITGEVENKEAESVDA